MPINDSNFLIWFDAGESQFDTPLPRPFVREPEVISPAVWLVPGETYTFYINSDDNTAPADTLILYRENGNTSTSLSNTFAKVEFPDGEHRTGSFTVPSLPEGLYRLGLGSLRTQWLYLAPAAKANKFSRIVQFRNTRRLQNFRYGYTNPDAFFQTFRIRMAVRSYEPESDKSTYREATTGKTRNYYSEPRMAVEILTPEYDFWAHRAMASLVEHDLIRIGGMDYAYHSAYKSNMNQGDALSEGEFSLVEVAYDTLVRA